MGAVPLGYGEGAEGQFGYGSSFIDFEPVYAALFALSAGLLGFPLARRRLKPFAEIKTPEYPCLFQGQKEEVNIAPKKGQPAKWRLSPLQYLFVHAGSDTTVDPATLLNPMLGTLRLAFPQADQVCPDGQFHTVQTLGGLVSHCFIERVEMWEGTLGPIEAAAIHFDILLTWL